MIGSIWFDHVSMSSGSHYAVRSLDTRRLFWERLRRDPILRPRIFIQGSPFWFSAEDLRQGGYESRETTVRSPPVTWSDFHHREVIQINLFGNRSIRRVPCSRHSIIPRFQDGLPRAGVRTIRAGAEQKISRRVRVQNPRSDVPATGIIKPFFRPDCGESPQLPRRTTDPRFRSPVA